MMSKTTFFILLSILCVGPIFSQYTSIPNSCFESILVSQNIDSDNTVNGQVLTSDINTITYLDLRPNIHTCSVSDIVGIEDFAMLEILNVNNANLSSIDMSSNLQLKRLFCKNNTISQINVTQNSLLELLDCSDNSINSIDVSYNSDLKFLILNQNYILNINLNNNDLLEIISIKNNLINSLNINNNINLRAIQCDFNPINSIDMTPHNLLEYINIGNTQLSNLDISQNIQLLRLRFQNTPQITNIDLTNNPQLNWLWCQDNNLTALDLSQNSLLDILNCSNNQLTALNVQNGANSLLTGTYLNAPFGYEDRFMADGNANLSCILVD
ncbi:MAG: hypothetical protein V3U80_10275, partial [Flavobacteriaceae bacterium]